MAGIDRQSWGSAIAIGAISLGGACVAALTIGSSPVLALPSPDEIPEEVLRNRVELGGRSAIDNTELSPSEYAELKALLEDSQEVTPSVSPELQRLILLLKLRKLLQSVTPF